MWRMNMVVALGEDYIYFCQIIEIQNNLLVLDEVGESCRKRM